MSDRIFSGMMSGAVSPFSRVPWATIAALLIAAVAVAATLRTIDFPLGTFSDEYAKVSAMQGEGNFLHPLFMIHIAKGVDALAAGTEPQVLADTGRGCAALFGGILVLATFGLALTVLPPWLAVVSAAVTAMTPLVTVHARVFKEDIFLAPFIVLSLLALIGLLREPSQTRAVLLGVLMGLAAGTKYVGALLLPFALVSMAIAPSPEGSKWSRRPALVLAAMALVFLLIESPAILSLVQFKRDFSHEMRHMAVGHDVPLPVTLTYGVFHLSQSLWSGLGAPLLFLGVAGLAAPFFASRDRTMPLAVIASFSVVWYAAHELSPLKPYPDFARYMLPLASLLPILGIALLHEVLSPWDRRGWVAACVALLAALPGLWTSVRANSPSVDPRSVVASAIATTTARAVFDRYTTYDTSGRVFGRQAIQPEPGSADLLVTSSFAYDRFNSYPVRALGLRGTRFYKRFTALPHLDVSNGRPALGYFNPTLRVVALDGNVETLRVLAAKIGEAAPTLDVSLEKGE